ncbi:MAG TPA: 4-hydroxy-3-methylbut-2-enyl diphosphate reductase [Actinomycetota bacterium]
MSGSAQGNGRGRRVQLVVLAPLSIEGRAIRSALPGALVLQTGMGRTRSARTMGARLPQRTKELLEGSGTVAVAGFCGALDPSLRPGDLVVATEVRGPDGVTPCPSAGILAAALARMGLAARLGPIVTTDHVVSGSERARLREETGAIAVDMESAWAATAAGDRPFAVLRVVVDTPRRELTGNPLSTARGGLRAYRALAKATPALASWAEAAGPRTVLLAGPRSFCAGVERAIEIVERALDRYGPPVYVRKQIVHNVHVVRDLERRGAVFVESAEEVPEGATVVFSAHGVSPEVREQARVLRLHVIDATCPLVTKVHTEARRFAGGKYTIFLIGHDGHEEVEGTTGEAPSSIRLIEKVEDVDGVEVEDPDRVAYLSQTTLAVDEVDEVVGALRDRFPSLTGPGSDDICYATQNRQDAVKVMARECDLLLVIGSENSSNSKRLVEVAEREGCRAALIDDETGIDPGWLVGAGTVGVTAGASAPEILVDRVLHALAGLGKVNVEERQVTTESMRFTLPVELRQPEEMR